MHKHITSSSMRSMCIYNRFSRGQVGFNWVFFLLKHIRSGFMIGSKFSVAILLCDRSLRH